MEVFLKLNSTKHKATWLKYKIPLLKHFANKEPITALFVFTITYFALSIITAPLPVSVEISEWIESLVRLVSVTMGLIAFFGFSDNEDEIETTREIPFDEDTEEI